ncbi:hypothetical protein GRF29_19g2581680 [Pseudopithomyces chartarum]|uniref:Uncharacterized protein n=1 Tax=Pseudopithomyces chartarum TaxID=1892770 RepID=A0AAN6M5C0_9PLEO|nr:hypothetical protein GRF29_19g2581680 [Pseudopithomyces chartarum]
MHPTALFALLLTTTLALPLAAPEQGIDLSPILDTLTGKKTETATKRAVAQIQPKVVQMETGHSMVKREKVGVWVESGDLVHGITTVKPQV